MMIPVFRTGRAAFGPLLAVSSVALLSVSAGCLVTSNTQESRSGSYVADSTFDQIRPQESTAGWVQATLGKPTSIDRLEDGTEIWKYSYTVRKESSGGVFLIFGGHNADEVQHTAFVQIKDGLVTRAWRT
jgi:outer membrane protein assembly factor BamE (lipoprotein component of BamABCDE complex)